MERITILGSTGSIGTQTLAVIAKHPEKFRVRSLAAHRNAELMLQQCQQFRPKYAVLVDHHAAQQLQQLLKATHLDTEVLSGEQALVDVACDAECDVIMAAIVGAAGLRSTFAAVRTAKRVLLANKESLVMAGNLLTREVRRQNSLLLPVDSEHSAIFQCLPTSFRPIHDDLPNVSSVTLTASGGIFRDWPLAELKNASPELAIKHPNWNMGAKVTVDCATMMNKGLELIETFWFFNLAPEQINAVIHPQSTAHSFVHFRDGSTLAQFGLPDMRTPISYALAWPQRIESGVNTLDIRKMKLDFFEMDLQRYPCFKLARAALQQGGSACIILNAANEIAVQAFLQKQISYIDIAPIIDHVLNQCEMIPVNDLEHILTIDQMARCCALEQLNSICV